MPSVTASQIVTRASRVLADVTATRWPTSDLLDWLNEAQRAVVIVRPDSNAQRSLVATVAGTRQTLPANGYALIKVVRNMGAAGATPGAAVRMVTADHLDAHSPNWHAATAAATTLNAVYDVREPKTFYVYPPAVGGHRLEVVHSAAPADCAVLGDVISLDDVYAPALLDYMLWRAFSQDFETADSASRAERALASFQTHLGLKAAGDNAVAARGKAKEAA